ncbi:MAG: PEP-CTERM sorting domain-containing protein [Burkholderiales bacterium]
MPIAQTCPTVVETRQPQLGSSLHLRLAAGQRFPLLPVLAALAFAFAAPEASAVPFAVTSGTDTGAKSLAASETGTVSAGASLSVRGSSVAVTFTGNNASVTNLGSMLQTGTGRLFRDNTGLTGIVINNGSTTNSSALMRTANGDVIQMAQPTGGVVVNNYGSMISLNPAGGGSQVIDFAGVTTGTNTVNNFAAGLIQASEADAVRPGVNGTVNNYGSILAQTSTGSSSDGIDLQNNSGGTVVNYGTGTVTGGRHGITGGALNSTVNWATSIDNRAGGSINGSNGSGVNLDGFNNKQVVTVSNAGTILGTGVTGDGDGIDVDGIANITNSGVIRSANSFSAITGSPGFSEGITIGGGTVTNSGTIEGLVSAGNTNALGRGITFAGNDITTGPLIGTREGLYGNAVVINNAGGLIRGQNDSAIVVEGAASIYTVSITNNAGATIQGGSSTAAAIRTGADAATLVNAGTINGSSSGKAFQGGSGATALSMVGGQASVSGDIDGGSSASNTIVIHPGAGNSFSYSGSLSNFSSVEVQSGSVTLSGSSGYSGTTKVNGGTLTLDGANRLSSASALSLGGGTLKLANAGGANGQTFSSLLLAANSAIDLGGSSLTFNSLGNIAAGKSLTLFNYVMSLSPDYAIRIFGDVTSNSDFQALVASLSINGVGATYRFDGAYTDIAPVPLPPSVALLLAGIGCIGMLLRRRRPG